jgi:hypothetical protein
MRLECPEGLYTAVFNFDRSAALVDMITHLCIPVNAAEARSVDCANWSSGLDDTVLGKR